MFTKDLSANVPLYGQEHCTWCGPACAQMIRNGYPNPADRLFFTQTYLMNTIQADNSTDPVDQGWATDPHGLTACLQSLNNPSWVHWTEFADTVRESVLFDILFWMDNREFPCAVLINHGGHWVTIVAFVTDIQPVAGSTPSLQSIRFHDPEPHNVGTDTTMTGAQWIDGPWNGAIIHSGTWYNKYVAVIEPPIAKGELRVKPEKRTGVRLISTSQAMEHAKKSIAERRLAEQPQYSLLDHKNVRPLEPMLVCEEPVNRHDKKVPCYYIVPFGFKDEANSRGEPTVRVCVLVNAYSGQFEEVTAFGRPVSYLSKEDALKVVGAAMKMDRKSLTKAKVTLVFQPSDITHIRTWPFWQVKLGKRTLFVDQLGKLYGKLLPSIPGD